MSTLSDRHQSGEGAALVHIKFRGTEHNEDIDEFLDLVKSAGATQGALITGARNAPDPKYFVGSGKAQEIKRALADNNIRLVIFNHDLSPSQERNLEQLFACRVMGRTSLILDIFAQRARSHEGKLQVELAQLRYISTRLVRGWTHLERQKGGIGLRGPGETQLETDRRLLGVRIRQINKRLEKVSRQRQQSRQTRQKVAVPTLSLVGYTNAGKSSIFNALTQADVFSANQLFATLDPTLRQYELPNNERVVLADTVGFIRHLPHELIAAFRATLQETKEADLLLHVVDANDPRREDYIEQVNQVLTDIGAGDVAQLHIYNKIDLSGLEPKIERNGEGAIVRVWVSAKTGQGLELLVHAITEVFARETVHGLLDLPPQAGRVRAKLFEVGAVLQEKIDDFGICRVEFSMSRQLFEEITRQENLSRYMSRDDFRKGLIAVR